MKFKVNSVVSLALLVVMATAFVSCNRKNDSWLSRNYHKTTARFNPYFNGEQAYIQGVENVETGHVDDYSEILSVYRWGSEKTAASVEAEMNRTIEKCTKVIQEHSMVIKDKQKNIYAVKSYLLMGKARFYKYEFFPSLETFNYIIQQYSKDKKATEIVHEAQLWAGRCQLMIDNTSSAEAYFNELYQNKKVEKKLKPHVSASMAQMFINKGDYESAVLSLREAAKEKPKKELRIRWKFIEAQLHEKLGNNYEASQAYKEVILMKPANYDMYFVAQLNRAKNFDVYLENVNIVYRELNKMLEDEKNIEYRDQIYYVMGEVALAEEEYEKADGYFKKSIRASVNNNTQKGLSYLKIADVNFSFKEYVLAQSYYDSASTTLSPAHKLAPYATKRKESLLGLVQNLRTIEVEDSLQRIAKLSPEAQRKAYEKHIAWLKEEEERVRREKELRELNEQLAANSQNMAGNPSVGGSGGWYFYNEGTRASGMSRFQSKWGNRKLEDNWRLKNKESVAISEQEQTNNTDQSSSSTEKKGGKYDPDFYLAQVPNTPEMLDTSNQKIMRAYVALGDIYKEELKDYDESAAAYKKELERFPGKRYEPRVLFSLYRLYIGLENKEQAETYKQQLLSQYPSSIYAKLILNEGKVDKTDEEYKKAAALYESTFDDYKKGNYKTVLKTIGKNRDEINASLLAPKFDLLEAMSFGRLQKEKEFIAGLQNVIAKHPNTPEAIAAQNTLNLTDFAGDETPQSGSQEKLNNFIYEANSGHKFVIIFPNNGVDLNRLKNAVADFNQQSFKLERLQMQNIFFDKDHQMIVVNGLKNAAKARVYYQTISADQTIMGYLPAQITTRLIVSDKNYVALYKDKNLQEYMLFLKDKYQIQ